MLLETGGGNHRSPFLQFHLDLLVTSRDNKMIVISFNDCNAAPLLNKLLSFRNNQQQAWENYVQVRERVRNVHFKIHDAHENYVHVTYPTNKWFLNFVWLIMYLYFCILVYRLFTVCFIKSFFLRRYKNISHENMFGLCKDIKCSLWRVLNFRMVTIFSSNCRYIFLIYVWFLCIKEIRVLMSSLIN